MSRRNTRTGCINGLYEQTAAQRPAEREFLRRRDREDKSDARPWEDD